MVYQKGQIPWNLGKKHSEETCKKISKARTGQKLAKGKVVWNKGKKWSKEMLKKLSLSHMGNIPWIKGKGHSEESRKKISEGHRGQKAWNKGIPQSEEAKEKVKNYYLTHKYPMEGKHHSKETIEKERFMHLGKMVGKDNPRWLGGISFEPYGLEFNDELKEKIRQRDNYRCQECFRHQDELYTKSGIKYKLAIHHIDYNKNNNNENNLISLCKNCHIQTNYSREDWTNYYKNRLI